MKRSIRTTEDYIPILVLLFPPVLSKATGQPLFRLRQERQTVNLMVSSDGAKTWKAL